MLHIINKSPFQTTTLDSCLDTALPGSAILFIEDGVYAVAQGSAIQERMKAACSTFKVFALQPDLDARGATSKAMEGVTMIDYGGFVDLTIQYSTSHTWL